MAGWNRVSQAARRARTIGIEVLIAATLAMAQGEARAQAAEQERPEQQAQPETQPPRPLPQAGPTIRASVNRVNLGVTVSDSNGRFVPGLKRQDFRVFDNGVEQTVADFLPVEEPAQFLLLVESGPSVFLFAKNHVLAADALIASVAPADRVAIASYSRGPELLLDFTADKTEARTALRSLDFHAGFGELNLSASLIAAIDWLAGLKGKKSVVLLATGVDTSETTDWDAVRRKLQTADVKIITVSLSGDLRKMQKRKRLSKADKDNRVRLQQELTSADGVLRDLAQESGGRAYFAKNRHEFSEAYAEIAELLRHEYSLAFAPATLDGTVHKLRVEVAGGKYSVDHRPAYLAEISK
jgi:VWFA-related protein